MWMGYKSNILLCVVVFSLQNISWAAVIQLQENSGNAIVFDEEAIKKLENELNVAENISGNGLLKLLRESNVDLAAIKNFSNCTEPKYSLENSCLKKMVNFNRDEIENFMPQSSQMPTYRILKKRRVSQFPKLVEIPIGGWKNSSNRHVRRADACSFPSAMDTAAISCKVFPSSVKCVQKCAFGFRMENGIEQEMQCSMKENKWTPTGFHECRPFVDCTMSLTLPGSMKCSTATLYEGPQCEVECLNYEDKESVSMSTYSCNIDGEWDPPAPFCVSPNSGLILVPAPTKKLHDE